MTVGKRTAPSLGRQLAHLKMAYYGNTYSMIYNNVEKKKKRKKREY
jgi:hypothetical protein